MWHMWKIHTWSLLTSGEIYICVFKIKRWKLNLYQVLLPVLVLQTRKLNALFRLAVFSSLNICKFMRPVTASKTVLVSIPLFLGFSCFFAYSLYTTCYMGISKISLYYRWENNDLYLANSYWINLVPKTP